MLDRATIERAKARAGKAPIVIALSGGGDSTALLHLLVDEFGVEHLYALVVDHALREGSAGDALRAKGLAEALNVPSEILTLSWPDGPKRAQQATRRARYAALCEAARKLGANVIALAHSADDQAETVLMRAASGSGWRGLAGMAAIAPAPIWPEGRCIVLARPLLNARRDALRACLRARGATWIEDPANTNPAFERARVRARLVEYERGGFDLTRLCAVAARLRGIANKLDAAARALIEAAARFEGDRICVDTQLWRGDALVRRRALSALLMAAAGEERAPEADALARLDGRLTGAVFSGATLNGAMLSRQKGAVVIARDSGALLGRSGGVARLPELALEPGEEAVWDGRLALTAPEPGWVVSLGDDRAPILCKAGLTLSLEDAPVRCRWLLEDHARYLVDVG
jgi:tRNA(Ile)-lysidine synthase